MKQLLTIILSLCCLAASAQTPVKKVAILETVDKMGNVPYGVLLQVRSSLTYAISSNAGYEGYDRVDMAAITGEQNFQRTGMVSDEQIKRLGEMTGAAYVLIAEAALYDDQNIIIAAKILDVETGGVMSSTPPSVAPKDPVKMADACIKCSQILVGDKTASQTSANTANSSSYSSAQQNTTSTIQQSPNTNLSMPKSADALAIEAMGGLKISTSPNYSNSNKAYIHIRRPFQYVGSGIKHFLEVLGINMGNFATNSCLCLVVNPGYIDIKDYFGNSSYKKLKERNNFINMSLDVEAGKKYYIKLDEALNKVTLESEAEANKYKVQTTYEYNN